MFFQIAERRTTKYKNDKNVPQIEISETLLKIINVSVIQGSYVHLIQISHSVCY